MTILPTKVELGAFAAGEVPPPLHITYLDFLALPVDLTGYVSLQMNIEEELSGTTGLGTGSIGVIGDPTLGVVEYTWVREDMLNVGEYTAQAWVNNGTNYFASDLYIFTVYDGPGEPPA